VEPQSFLKQKKYRPSMSLQKLLERIGIMGTTTGIKPVEKDKATVTHTADMGESVIAEWGEGAAELWNDFAKECFRRRKSSGFDSVWSRPAEKALRVATILSTFQEPNSPVVCLQTLAWAIEWQRELALTLERMCEEFLGKGQEKMCRDKIISILEREGGTCSRGRIGNRWAGWDKIDERVKQAAIESLERDGIITVKVSGSNKNRGMQSLTLQR
jgi:hypothetical protein